MAPMVVAPAMPQLDPQPGVHRQSPVTSSVDAAAGPFYSTPSTQDQAARYQTPYANAQVTDNQVAAQAQGRPTGPYAVPVGYSTLDYGSAPTRIPRLWRDGTRSWESLNQRGGSAAGCPAHVNHWLWLPHLRPSMPTRGFRSVSGMLAGQGPTASNVRVPAVFIPSGVA